MRATDFAVPVVSFGVVVAAWGLAYSADKPGDEIDPTVIGRFRDLNKSFSSFNWETEYPHLQQAIKNIWELNGWNSEADRFARDTAMELAAVPPWKPLRRLELLSERLEKRYGLSGEKRVRFQRMMMREAGRFLVRNGGVIFDQAREWLQMRASGEPFTAEQVARWTKEGHPLLNELRNGTDRIVKELEPMLAPDKQRVLRRDLKSYEKRQRVMDEMAARWIQGRWHPVDWGLQDDPIQRLGMPADVQKAPPRPRRSATAGGSFRPTIGRRQPLAHAPSTWYIYVQRFQARFNLDPGQMNTAESIHNELVKRAKDYIASHVEELKVIPLDERMNHEAYEPVRSLFRELQERLNAIPTSSQRELAKQ